MYHQQLFHALFYFWFFAVVGFLLWQNRWDVSVEKVSESCTSSKHSAVLWFQFCLCSLYRRRLCLQCSCFLSGKDRFCGGFDWTSVCTWSTMSELCCPYHHAMCSSCFVGILCVWLGYFAIGNLGYLGQGLEHWQVEGLVNSWCFSMFVRMFRCGHPIWSAILFTTGLSLLRVAFYPN